MQKSRLIKPVALRIASVECDLHMIASLKQESRLSPALAGYYHLSDDLLFVLLAAAVTVNSLLAS